MDVSTDPIRGCLAAAPNACSTICACASSPSTRRRATSAPCASSTVPRPLAHTATADDLRRFPTASGRHRHQRSPSTPPSLAEILLRHYAGRPELDAQMTHRGPCRALLPVILSPEEVGRPIAAGLTQAPGRCRWPTARTCASARWSRSRSATSTVMRMTPARGSKAGAARTATPCSAGAGAGCAPWWRLGHAQGKIRHGGSRLFPAWTPPTIADRARQLNRAAPGGRHRCGIDKRITPHGPCATPLPPPTGAEGSTSASSGAARPQAAGDHQPCTPPWPPTCCAG